MADGSTTIPFPLDFATIRRDEIIPRERCERIIAILWATGRIRVRNPLNERPDEPIPTPRGGARLNTAAPSKGTTGATVIVATVPPDTTDPGPPPVYGMTAYQEALWRLADMITDGIAERLPNSFVACRSGALHILTGQAEAEVRNRKLTEHVRGIVRETQKMARVDTSEMTAEQFAEHERRLMRAGRMSAAVVGARRAPDPPKLEAK